jgi:c-di-GMP-binding flagellar brake protein YcgR
MVQQVNLSAIIRNAYIQADAAENKSYVFGLQFLEMSDAARLVISNYIYEQREQ